MLSRSPTPLTIITGQTPKAHVTADKTADKTTATVADADAGALRMHRAS